MGELFYRAYGWHVEELDDGNILGAIERAIQNAKDVGDRPLLISVRTVLGYGGPDKQGTFAAHGSPPRGPRAAQGEATPRLARGAAILHPDEALAHFGTVAPVGRWR